MGGVIKGDGEKTEEEKEDEWYPPHVRITPPPPTPQSWLRLCSQYLVFILVARPPLTCPLTWGNLDHPDPGAITTETEGTGSPANFCELGNRSIMLFVSDYSAQIGERSIVMSVSVCACVFVCPR